MTGRVRAAAVVGIGAALALSGCGGSSGSAATTGAGGTSAAHSSASARPDVSITHADATSIARSYDRRNDVAISKALNPPYDASAWRTVDSGPVLAIDAYDTEKAAFNKSTEKGTSAEKTKLLRAYGSSTRSSDGTSPWVLVVEQRTGGKSAKTAPAYAGVFVKGPQGWHMDSSIGGISGINPKALPRESTTAPTLTKVQRQSAANAVPVVVDALTTGNMKHVSNPVILKELRTGFQMEGVEGFSAGATCRPWGTKQGTDPSTAVVVGSDALRLTRAGTETIAVLNLDCRLDVYAQDGGTVRLDKDNAHVEGDDGKDKETLVRRAAMELLFSVPDKGSPTMLGAGGDYLIPPGR